MSVSCTDLQKLERVARICRMLKQENIGRHPDRGIEGTLIGDLRVLRFSLTGIEYLTHVQNTTTMYMRSSRLKSILVVSI